MKSLDVPSEFKLSNLLNDFVLPLLVEQKVEVDSEDFYVFIVVQNFFKKLIFIDAEKVQGLFGDTDLFGPFEELD